MLNEALYLLVSIVSEAVECHHDCLSKALHVAHMLVEVGKTLLESFDVWLLDLIYLNATVHLKAVASSHYYCELWAKASFAAFDVEELLCTEVSTEACFCHNIVSKAQSHLGCKDSVAAVSNVGEWATMNDCRGVLSSLHEVWHECFLEQYTDRTSNAEILDSERSAVILIAEQDILDAATEVFTVGSKTENSHDL